MKVHKNHRSSKENRSFRIFHWFYLCNYVGSKKFSCLLVLFSRGFHIEISLLILPQLFNFFQIFFVKNSTFQHAGVILKDNFYVFVILFFNLWSTLITFVILDFLFTLTASFIFKFFTLVYLSSDDRVIFMSLFTFDF